MAKYSAKRGVKRHNNANRRNMTVFHGSQLTNSTINKAIKLMPPEVKQRTIEQLWEFIPDGEYTEQQKLGFIIAAIPQAGIYTPEQIAAILSINNPALVNPKDFPDAKPAVYHRLKNHRPDILEELITKFRPHKHVPKEILENDMWVGIMAIGFVIDTTQAAALGGEANNPFAILESYKNADINRYVNQVITDPDELANACVKCLQFL